MKAIYRYIGGGKSGIMGDGEEAVELSSFGQTVEMDQTFAENAVRHNRLLVLPDDKFKALGFTADELTAGNAPSLAERDKVFAAKYDASRKAFHDWHLSLSSPQPQQPAADAAE